MNIHIEDLYCGAYALDPVQHQMRFSIKYFEFLEKIYEMKFLLQGYCSNDPAPCQRD
jgi:hypothetical protein